MSRKQAVPQALADKVMLALTAVLGHQAEEDRDLVLRAIVQSAEGLLAARRELRRVKTGRARD